MARKSKIDELREKFEVALKKGLESESAVERTAAIKATADMLNPNLGDLQAQLKQAEDARAAAEESLATLTAERDALAAKVAELQPQADRLPAVEAELSLLKANGDEWKAEQTKLLTADTQQMQFKAQRAERQANATMAEAQSLFGQAGLQLLLDQVKKIVEQHSIPEPDLGSLPSGISPLLLTAWGYTPTRARIALGYAQSYREPNEAFKDHAFRILSAGLPTWGVVSPSQTDDEPLRFEHALQPEIPDLGVRRECLIEMARRWNVLTEIQQHVDKRQSEILGQHAQQVASDLQAQQIDMTMRGYGREAINVQPEQQSITGYVGEHPGQDLPIGDPGRCVCPKCNPHSRATSIDPVGETL